MNTYTVQSLDLMSHLCDISVTTIQGSGLRPVSYIVTASDLHPVNSGNLMSKYADDTYLIVSASNAYTFTVQSNTSRHGLMQTTCS